MSETEHYKLYVTDDDSEKFKTWREKMNGAEDSNMQKIDTALSEKAEASVLVTATLSTDAWECDSAPYTQTLDVEGLTADQNGNIFLAQNATSDERAAAVVARLSVTGQAEGQLTITADGTKPSMDIPVGIILLG